MTYKTYLGALFFALFLFNCNEKIADSIHPQIIPIPSQVTIQEGDFILNADTQLVFDSSFQVSANFLKTFIAHGSAIKLTSKSGKNKIIFVKNDTLTNEEGYQLKIDSNSITITASSDKGAFYAVQSLRQLLPVTFENGTFKDSNVAIKCVDIEDEPRFVYRGMHLDVGRHFFSVDFIKKYIDALALLKMNTFHWHLTEDQGWRIEIKKYPKLNEIAAYRKETLIGHYSDQPHQFDGKKYGGYYSQEEVKDIVKYATNRKITIIPEIEMPGHSQAAIAAYPELGCTGNPVEVATKWGVFEEVYCTKEETFTFLENVLDEVMALFPGTYIHIGGDEAPKTRWKACDVCQKRIKTEGLKDAHELQSYFISRMEAYINSKGKQIIGWDEILEGGLAPNATVMSWRGVQGAIDAAKQHHNVVLTPQSNCYFDHYQSTNENEPLAIGGFLPLKKVYDFNIIPESLSKEEQRYVLGAQGNVWTEYMPNSKQVEYMVFPRILAMSEAVWSKKDRKVYADFISRLEYFNTRLDVLDINYANHLYEVKGEVIYGDKNIAYALTSPTEGKTIHYTLNNEAPTVNDSIYTEPITIEKSTEIKAAVFNAEGKQLSSVFSQSINYHKAVGKTINLSVAPHKSYNTGGKNALINGIDGSNKRYGDKEWLGFSGDDVLVTIDLNEKTPIASISTRFYNGNGQWIYAPKQLEVSFNDKPFQVYDIAESDEKLVNWSVSLQEEDVQKIQIKIPNYGVIPEGKQGAGHRAWLFIDEIKVN